MKWLDSLRWWMRLPLKWSVLALTVFLVCFPYPWIFVRHVRHWKAPNSLIEPEHPGLINWIDQLRPKVATASSPQAALSIVERFVYDHVPYDWDWNVWGTSDYLPTVTEVLEKKREDCDGRAVVGASVLKGLGYEAEIVADFTHVWIKTNQGETMSPGPRPVVVATPQGVKVESAAYAPMLRAFGYGISVFPAIRECIVIAVAWLLLASPRRAPWRALASAVFFSVMLICLRLGGNDHRNPIVSLQWIGLGSMLMGLLIPFIGRRADGGRHTSPTIAAIL
jgi:hypothetical protein